MRKDRKNVVVTVALIVYTKTINFIASTLWENKKNADVTKEYSCGHWSDVFNDIEWPYYF